MRHSTASLRRHRRFTVDVAAGAGARLRDVSLGGMRVLTKKALRIDESVETSLSTPHGVLRLKGWVVRAARSRLEQLPYEYGIEFKPLAAADEVVLRRHLDSLAANVVAEPESPVEALDLLRMQDRIAELERELDLNSADQTADGEQGSDAVKESFSEPGSSPGSAAGPASQGPDESKLITEFDVERFNHLVRLGQRLTALVDDPSDRVAGDECRAVARSFDGRFSLESITEVVTESLDEETILTALFTFYERNLIDFA